MRTLIVYFSKFGNTRKLAEAMAEMMEPPGDARAIDIDQLAASDFEGVDLVVMGSPTHAFSVPQAVRSALESLPLAILGGKSVATFDTTVRRWPFRHLRASPKLLSQLTRLGGTPTAKPETFFVHMRNPEKTGDPNLLLDGELERARQWAARLLQQASARQRTAT